MRRLLRPGGGEKPSRAKEASVVDEGKRVALEGRQRRHRFSLLSPPPSSTTTALPLLSLFFSEGKNAPASGRGRLPQALQSTRSAGPSGGLAAPVLVVCSGERVGEEQALRQASID